MSESIQHKLDRVRPPRVQITYDVETGGAAESKELPMVVGVMADLSGTPENDPKQLKDRNFVPIDRDNFNEVLQKTEPRVVMQVKNRLEEDDDSNLSIELKFRDFSDFEPTKVARQVPALSGLLDIRDRLNQLLSKMEGNDDLCGLLDSALTDEELRATLAKEIGIGDA